MPSLEQTATLFEEPASYWQQSTFLNHLRGNGKYKYKRYNGLPLRYAGGKSLAVGHVLEHLPNNIKTMMSPFFGGGAIEIACARELGIDVQGYDIFNLLTNFWQVVLKSPDKLAAELEKMSPTKTQYEAVKKRLKAHWDGKKKIVGKMELATLYWFNHNLSYGPGFLGWMSSIYECENRYQRLLNKIQNFYCRPLSVATGSFEKTIPTHDGTFLYCDPPYYLNDGKMFRGIYPQRNFPVHHNGFDHLLLSQLLKRHKGGFILSYNDCDTIRELYAGYKIVEVEWQYTMGQGETRIGKNREGAGTNHVKESHEILIVDHG